MVENKEKRLMVQDYYACDHCKFFDEFGTHAPTKYCKKEHPNPYESLEKSIALEFHPESPTKSIYDIIDIGCSKFEWNGIPVNKKAMERIKSELPDSALLKLTEDVLTDLTFSEITKDNGFGAYFNRERFEKEHPK